MATNNRTNQAHAENDLISLGDTVISPVVEVSAEPWALAMTFTRDLAVVTDDIVIPLMPHRIRGTFEAPLTRSVLVSLGLELTAPSEPLRFDGGNVRDDCHGRLLVGVLSDQPTAGFVEAVRFLEAATGRPAYRVPLAGGRLPHLDMAMCDLNGRAWLVSPDGSPGFDLADRASNELFLGRPVIVAGTTDGEQLGCNLVVIANETLPRRMTHSGQSSAGCNFS